jgi:hypothetical protein
VKIHGHYQFEQSNGLTALIDSDALGGRLLGQPRHAHDVAAQPCQELGARRQIDFLDRHHAPGGRAAQQ